jgi:acetyltransferase
MRSEQIENGRTLSERACIPRFPFPERAASALGALVRRSEILARVPNGITKTRSHGEIFDSPLLNLSVTDLDELLKAYNIPTRPIKLAPELHEAESIADELGYPVVIKIASPDILRKSDVGGVILNIQNRESLALAYTQMMGDVKQALIVEFEINPLRVLPYGAIAVDVRVKYSSEHQ